MKRNQFHVFRYATDNPAARYIRCRKEQSEGHELAAADQEFVERVAAIGEILPGALDEILLEYGLQTAQKSKRIAAQSSLQAEHEDEEACEFRVAAATNANAVSIYDRVLEAIRTRAEFVTATIGNRTVQLLRLLDEDGLVEACFVEGFTFEVEDIDGARRPVTREGSPLISLERLKELQLFCDEHERTLRLTRT